MSGFARCPVSMFGVYRRLDKPSPTDILASYVFPQEDTDRAWIEYNKSSMGAVKFYPEPIITELCPDSVEFVIAPRTLAINGFELAHLERVHDEDSHNFMSLHPGGQCILFSGEMRLLKLFLEVADMYFETGSVSAALTRPRNLGMPPVGMNPGYGFAEWQDKAKICDCVLFIA